MKQQLISIGLSLAFLFCLGTAQAQNNKRDFNRRGAEQAQFQEKRQVGAMYEKLLTDEQKATFKEFRLESMKEAKPFQDELRERQAHHQTLMTAESPNLNEIYASIEKIGELKSELAKIKAKTRVEMSTQLTDEQKLQMAQFHSMRKNRTQNHPKKQEIRGW